MGNCVPGWMNQGLQVAWVWMFRFPDMILSLLLPPELWPESVLTCDSFLLYPLPIIAGP